MTAYDYDDVLAAAARVELERLVNPLRADARAKAIGEVRVATAMAALDLLREQLRNTPVLAGHAELGRALGHAASIRVELTTIKANIERRHP